MRIFSKTRDGPDPAADVSAAVGERSGAGRTGIAVIGHVQQDFAVSAPFLALQPFQYPLIAEGFHVVADPVEHILEKGIAPVDRTENTPEDTLERVHGPEVQKFVERYFVVDFFGRQRQHR